MNTEELTNNVVKALQERGLIRSEESLRAIIREEIAKWEQRQLQARRFGLPPGSEVK